MVIDFEIDQLRAEIESLRCRLEEAEGTIDAIRKGEVDAVVVSGPDGHKVYSLEGAEQFYRLLIEAMQQGAATLSEDGTILYCNRSLAAMLKVPQERLVGSDFANFVVPDNQNSWQHLLGQTRHCRSRGEISLQTRTGATLPVHLNLTSLPLTDANAFGLIVTDLTEQIRHQETLLQLNEQCSHGSDNNVNRL